MKRVVVLFGVVLAIAGAWWVTAGAAIPGPEVGVFMSPLEGPPLPFGSIQLIADPDFEAGPAGVMWNHYGSARVEDGLQYGGTYSLIHGGGPGYAWTQQDFSLDGCEIGPVWVRAAWTGWTPSPLVNPGYDITEGWIMNDEHISVAELWARYDTDMTGEYANPWIRVEGLFDVCTPTCTLNIASSVDSNPLSLTTFSYDDVEIYCLQPPYQLFIPLVGR